MNNKKFMSKVFYIILSLLTIVTSFPYQVKVEAANNSANIACPIPGNYTVEEREEAQDYIKQLGIPTKVKNKDVNIGYLLNMCGLGQTAVVYGSPADIQNNPPDLGQYRYLGYDAEGNLYRNWKFRSDSRETLHVAKNWVKKPWLNPIGINKGITLTSYSNNEEFAASYLQDMLDPYGESKTFLESYNKRKGTNWTGYDLLDYAIIQQPRTIYSPGVVQMWNIWQPDGSWWYEMFTIPAPPLPEYKPKLDQPDLIISNLVTDPVRAAQFSLIGDQVSVKITTKNQGNTNSGPFTVGIVGTNIKSEVISNVPPGQIKTVTVKVSSPTSGIKKYTAKTDFGMAVDESNEDNNTKDFQIVFSNPNEPSTPVAVISHLDGDHRDISEITIKPGTDPKLDDHLSYSPGGEAITQKEWKYTPASSATIMTKPAASAFLFEGTYTIELRVTNSAGKVSEWAMLKIKVTTQPVATPTPVPSDSPEPTPTPMDIDIRFSPEKIIAGETSSLLNISSGYDSSEWEFSSNLDPLLADKTSFEYRDITFHSLGIYQAKFSGTNDRGTLSDTAYLQVIDPKPVAIVSGVNRVVEGRPFPVPFGLDNSYTPLAFRGETIDHSRDEKRFKRADGAAYTSGFPVQNNLPLGEYTLEGKVYDSTGRVSDWGTHPLTVVPDLPPTVEITAPEEVYRQNEFMLFIEAESPDGDIIEGLLLEERHDSNDNGDYDDESWVTLYDGAFKSTYTLNYSTVGKRQYRATVTEDYGLKGISEPAYTNALNYAPTVNFNAFGLTEQPDQGEDSGPPETLYTADSIFRSWTLKKPYIGGNEDKIAWKTTGSAIGTKAKVLPSYNLAYPEAGMGRNSRNLYSLADDVVSKGTWTIPHGTWVDQGIIYQQIFGGERVYSYNNKTTVINDWNELTGYNFTMRNAVTGAPLASFTIDMGVIISNLTNFSFSIEQDENLYFKWLEDNQVKIRKYNNTGSLTGNYSIPLASDTRKKSIFGYTVSSDSRYIIVAVDYLETNDNLVETKFYKLSLETGNLLWTSNGGQLPNIVNPLSFQNVTMNMILDTNGTLYAAGRVFTKITSNGTRIDSARLDADPYSDTALITDQILKSDDGQYIYLLTYKGRDNYAFSRTYRVFAYRTSDHALVNNMVGLAFSSGEGYPSRMIVKEDGSLEIVTANYIYNITKEGAFSHLINTRREDNLYLSGFTYSKNGDYTAIRTNVAAGSYGNMNITYSLYDLNKEEDILGTAGGTITHSNTTSYWNTPVYPNGNMYAFTRTGSYTGIQTFGSRSGKAGIASVDDNTIAISNDDWGGLYYDAGSIMKNYAFEFNASVNEVLNDKAIGAAFHIQNERNMYAVEWSKDTLTLFKVVNGAKTILQSIALPRSAFNTYPIKVEAINGMLRVYVNHVKYLEVADATFTKGAAGFMSLGQQLASFSNVKKTNYGDFYVEETYETVLVNEPIIYDKLFDDIEKDPAAAEKWTYSHNPNYFLNPEGISIHHGQSYDATVDSLEKPGVYDITYQAQDDPGLTSYRKWSGPVTKLLYVHRRPVAQPHVVFTGRVYDEGEVLDYDSHDASYDPDMGSQLSGKLFRTRWADETTWTTGKRQFYNRPGVELIVQEQVRDIHGAWSYWAQTVVFKDALPAVNQHIPIMTITSPSGQTAAAPTVLGIEPTITWTYADADNDPQELYRLSFTYVDTNETTLYLEHEGAAISYKMLEDSISPGRVVKVQGQVYSKGAWSRPSNIRYFVLNLPPETYLLSLNGPDADHPIYTRNNRSELRVFTIDPENQPITAIDYEVYRASDGARVVDTNAATSAASYTTTALSEGLHYWRARAHDGFVWGEYSSNGFFFVDTIKPADVDEQLEIEATAVTVRFNAFSDPQPSSGHAARTFYLQKVNVNGSVTNVDLNGDGTAEYSIPIALTRQSFKVTGLIPGQEYRLTVLDHDVAGNEGHYAYIYFITNRPPTADFDWSPKPVYEGDKVTFASIADDPDGDLLSVVYELTSPSGIRTSYSYTLAGPSYANTGPMVKMVETGTWNMRLTVSDGIADPVIETKSVQVLPLQVEGYVKHTELWDQHRRDYNMKQSGQTDSPRGYSTFWAGEKFVLEADTTITGTATKAERVDVQMGSYSLSLSPTSPAQTSWRGELWKADFSELEEGGLAFTFTSIYSNGTIKVDIVEVTIKGQTLEIVGVHRVQ